MSGKQELQLDIEIGLSALNSGIYKIKFRNDYKYLLIHQVTDGENYSNYVKMLPANVRYIKSNEVGLSKSRNLAIEHSMSDYLWIMDDDVDINDEAFSYICDFTTRYNESPLLIVSHTLKREETDTKEKIQRVNIISAAKICSIDMIVKISALKNIRFNPNFGLGAKYPSGEEYIFACELIRSGGKVYKSNKVCSFHPEIVTNDQAYPNKDKFKTKMKMFIAANGLFVGSILYVAFFIKKNISKK
ncbi:glycosyltransferase [Citrobacter gillenii]|uniref:glycosyltransferase n=1 Tax=Citrobacter gillenii TaxID=67828 RepID=UPI00311CD1CB